MNSVNIPEIHLPTKRILDAFRAVHRQKGFANLSMRAVAKRAGITAAAIYVHYSSKEELIETVAEEGFLILEKLFNSASREKSSPRRVIRLLQAYREFSLEEPELYELMFETRRRNLRKFPSDFAEKKSRPFEILRRSVEECMAEGHYRRDDPLEVSLTLWGLVQGLIELHRVGRFGSDEASFRRRYDQSLKRILRGILQ